MQFDLPTVVDVRRRIERTAMALAMNPDGPYAEEIERRVMRIMRWLGPSGRAATRPYVLNFELDPGHRPSALRIGRGGIKTTAQIIPLRRRA